ncbi:MAG: hypothetical protein ACFE8N_01295 [Promethearchaeota archaeon]
MSFRQSILKNLSEVQNIEEINHIFNIILNETQMLLKMDPFAREIQFSFINGDYNYKGKFYNLGIRKIIRDNKLYVEIFNYFRKFLSIILLREAYLFFIPFDFQDNQIIQIIINQIVENDLSSFEVVKEWKKLIRSNVVNYDFLTSQFDKLDKFFKLKGTETHQDPIQFFFEFTRRNLSIITDKQENFYDILAEEFVRKTSKSLFNDEIIETLRVIYRIFSEVKFFKNYKEYEEYFELFKNKGIISTSLSKRRFSENLRWINDYTIISPSSYINWNNLDSVIVHLIIEFNPILKKTDIKKVLKEIPFFRAPRVVKNSFSEEIWSINIVPKVYLSDFMKFIEKLRDFGYITKTECYVSEKYTNLLNLNYYREYFKDLRKIINPIHKDYKSNYELEFNIDQKTPQLRLPLSILDWIILERFIGGSITGFGFERRSETLQSLKMDILNHIESERSFISKLKITLKKFQQSDILKKSIIEFLNENSGNGFFYIFNTLKNVLFCLDLIERTLKTRTEIRNNTVFKKFLNNREISSLIDNNLILNDKDVSRLVIKEFLPYLFTSVKDYNALKEKYKNLFDFMEVCQSLKIFDLNSMKEIIYRNDLPEKIYRKKENKLRQSFERFKPYQVTNQELDKLLDKYIKADIIKPLFINTILTSVFAKYHPVILLKDTPKVRKLVKELVVFFPRANVVRMKDLFIQEQVILIEIYFLNFKEKQIFCAIIYNTFKEHIITYKRVFFSGLSPVIILKDFYDFEKERFFYTRDLFEQSLLFFQKIFGDKYSQLHIENTRKQEKFWSKERKMLNLVKWIDKRVTREKIEFNLKNLNYLEKFHLNLKSILQNKIDFKNSKNKQFFKDYVNSIKFIPCFQKFGFSQYYLYFYPSNLDQIDFRHLLFNNFQYLKYPTLIGNSNSFIIKYVFPFGKPNMSHLNWYVKSKRIVREYCLFSIKKLVVIFNFNSNFSKDAWDYDFNRFKIHMQNVLFKPKYKYDITDVTIFNVGDHILQSFLGPDSLHYKALVDILNWKPIDIKSYLGTRNYKMIQNVTSLLSNDLIFPYIYLKNLDFQDKIFIILPNVKKEFNPIIIKIFNFFNYGFLYEIEGEYYIYGFTKKVNFENGIMLKLYFPQCEIDEFLKLFDLFFQYLGIDHYIILNDLVNGKTLLKSIYRDLEFLDSYNPLKNFIWNDKDKIWMNHKLFTKKFKPIYPDLIPKND